MNKKDNNLVITLFKWNYNFISASPFNLIYYILVPISLELGKYWLDDYRYGVGLYVVLLLLCIFFKNLKLLIQNSQWWQNVRKNFNKDR